MGACDEISSTYRLRITARNVAVRGVGVSIQIAILKVLASHGSGRATLASLKRDIAILTSSGRDWDARIKRLAGRVGTLDIFGSAYVLCDGDGWEITVKGRDFLQMLEAVTQDNRPEEVEPSTSHETEIAARPSGALIVVGHRFKNRRLRPQAPSLIAYAREESASKQK